jgi:hypothetical protein
MSRKSRMQDLREKKDRRMKIFAIGGVVLLAILLAFELPHYLGGGASAPAATTDAAGAGASATTQTATTPTTGTPTAVDGSGAVAVAPTTQTRLPNSDVAPKRTKSQLSYFSHFSGKNPFVQQVSQQAAPTSGTTSSGGTQTAASGVSGSAPKTAHTYSKSHSASVEVNGKVQTVQLSSAFPSSNPVFKLVSISNSIAKIGIANGTFSNGKQTVSVAVGRSLTLVNKANGHRYVLLLLSVS